MARPKNIKKRDQLIEVVDKLQDYWPITVRQCFYRMVSAGHIENNLSAYKNISDLLTELRHSEQVQWYAIADNHRRVTSKRGFGDSSEFLEMMTSHIKTGYSRCLISNQQNYVEVAVEKDTLASIIESITYPFCVRLMINRGNLSTTFKKSFAERMLKAQSHGQDGVLLYAGDFDASGMMMFESFKKSVEIDFGVKGIQWRRIALNPEQVNDLCLPKSFVPVKAKDPNAKKFIKEHGEYGVELDALDPPILQGLVRNAIEECFDMSLFAEQREIEQMERDKLAILSEKVMQQFHASVAA